MKTALTIAGSDCSGGAGIQADLKTFAAHKVYGMSAITALTAQNTTGVSAISESAPDFLNAQLKAVFTDIVPDAVKIGMVSSKLLIEVIAEALNIYQAKNIVLDPVMVSTSGSRLIEDDAAKMLMDKLMVIADIITPNIPETEVITGMSVSDAQSMESAAIKMYQDIKNKGGHAAVLVKGGHSVHTASDCLCIDGEIHWLRAERIDNPNTHGTGCTLSSAIAANLALGCDIKESVRAAKEYLTGALKAGLDLGKGSGPLDHTYWLTINR